MERIAVFSDVHADAPALESILAAAARAGIDRMWCLGDFVSGGADPAETFDLAVGHAEVVIGGNHEGFVVGKIFMRLSGGWADAAYDAYLKLGERRVRALAQLPAHGEFKALGVELIHGSLLDPTHGFIRTAADAYMSAQRATQPLVLYGHTHRPACFIAQPQGLPVPHRIVIGEEVALPDGVCCLLNPGAGCDRHGARWLELRIDGTHRTAIWHQTDTPGSTGRSGPSQNQRSVDEPDPVSRR